MRYDRMILGKDIDYSTDSNKTGVNNNVIVCGGSGSGKTFSITEPQLIETRNSSLITTVTKRRIVEKYTPMFERRGYSVFDLNFVHPERSNIAYDPLQYISSHADVTFLAESIVLADPRKAGNTTADPYWDKAAVSLLSAEIAAVRMLANSPTFADVLTVHDSLEITERNGMIETSLDKTFELLARKEPNCFAVSCWRSFRNLPVKTASCIFGTLNTTIDTIFSPELRELIASKKKIDFKNLASEKTVLFITTSPVNPALNCFVNMFYGQAFKQLFEFGEEQQDGRLPIPVRFICDDFATGCKVAHFAELISIFREKQISCTLLLQSESQLESMYGPTEATTIINNCDSYIYLGGMDLQTARSVSVRLDVPLDEVLYMPVGQEVIFRRGQRPVVTERYNITQNEIWKQLNDNALSKSIRRRLGVKDRI